MKLLCTSAIGVLLVCSGWTEQAVAARYAEVPASLERLASKAENARSWPELRRYGASRSSARERALTYFVLGYREYQSGNYEVAEKDLAVAAAADFSLTDLAEYYQASAAYKGGHPERTVSVLENFATQFPASAVHYEALQLLAWGYIQTGQPKSALQILLQEPAVRQRPSLALLLARAYLDDGQLQAAARTDQEIYYAFPTAPESKAAADALDQLRLQLGVSFPPVSDQIATARVEKLYAASMYKEALDGYSQLLAERSNSAWAWRWNLGRGKCLVRMQRADEAIETLVGAVPPTSEIDAERLATLVAAYVQKQNDTAIAETLDKLQSGSLRSPWHAAGLESAARYFARKDDKDIARAYYESLQKLFPQTSQGKEACWQLAWMSYLDGKRDLAQKGFLDLLKSYPDSPHVPAALYYLARLEEDGRPGEARAIYELLKKRYVNGYYSLQAARRLTNLDGVHARPVALETDEPPYAVVDLAARIPAADPPSVPPCLPSSVSADLRSFQVLKALDLDDLARQDLDARLARQPSDPALLLAASEFAAEQGRQDRALHIAKKVVPDYRSQQFADVPREVWNLLYPKDFWTEIRRYAIANHLDPYLVMAVVRQESGFNPRATSVANARGLMQVLPQTVTRSRRYRRTVSRRLYNPAYNLSHGCLYLKQVLKRFNGSLAEALAAYNAGPTRVGGWLDNRSFNDPEEFVESIPFQSTRVYVKAIFTDIAIYRQLMRKTVDFAGCPASPTAARKKSAAGIRQPTGAPSGFSSAEAITRQPPSSSDY